MPRYIARGVTTLKIQGREYPAPLIGELTRIYRRLVDQTFAGAPDVVGAHTALEPILAERDHCRSAKTGELHDRLLEKMAAERKGAAGTDWDPNSEETRLRKAESLA